MSVLDKFLDAIRLNDDFDDDDEFFDDEDLEALDEEKPKHRFFKKLDDDDDEDEEVEYVKPEKKVDTKADKSSETDCKAGNSVCIQQDHSDEKEKQRKWHDGSLCDQTFFHGRHQRDRRYSD